jgi:spore germination protein YaaH
MAQIAHQVLSVEKNRKNLERNILSIVKGNGFDGVNIDLEGVPPGDRAFYNKFLSELKQMFKPYGYLLTVSIPAKTADNPLNSWNGAYDYRTIGNTADLVALRLTMSTGRAAPPALCFTSLGPIKVLDTR